MLKATNENQFLDTSSYSELERLSALETLKSLANPESVKLSELVEYLEERGLWNQFAKITLGDLKVAFARSAGASEKSTAKETTSCGRRRKKRILDESFDDSCESLNLKKEQRPADGGLSTDEVAGLVLPFIEGNGDVTLDDIAEYTELDRRVLRHHMGVLIKEDRIERMGAGRNAVYSTLG